MDELELNKKLFEAVEANNVKRVDLLLKQGAWVLAENNFNETLLERAKTAEMAETLIANGMRLMTSEGESELFYVGVPEVVEVLIAHGADVNARNVNDETPLFTVNSAAVAEILIAHGADVNAKTADGATPLSRINSVDVAKVLIAHGADVNAKMSHGETPLFKTSSVEVAKVLIEHGADVNAVNDYGIPMINYATHEIADVVRACQQGKTDVTNRTKKN